MQYQQREVGVLVKLAGDQLHRLQSFGGDGLFTLAKLYQIQQRFNMRDIVPSNMHRKRDDAITI